MYYRKRKSSDASGILGLDSLMDILSCLVGVMLFLVIYSVLQLGSAAYQSEVVVSPEPTPGSQRVLVLCENGTVRVLDVRGPLNELLSGFEIVASVAEVPVFVEANPRAPTDQYFRYSLSYVPRSTTDLVGMLDLRVEEQPGATGDRLDQLDDQSRFAGALRGLSPRDAWLTFAVDSTSVDVFRRAREMAITRGFATGFDMLTLTFPLTLPLSQGSLRDLLGSLSTLSKPQR
jgi:hypothetical protein